MAFGTYSKIFRNFIADLCSNTTAAIDLDTDVPKCALYGNTGTPNQDDTAAHNAYAGTGGAWVTGNEVTDTQWAAGGRAITPTTHWNDTAATVWYDSTDTAGGGTVTVSNVYGCLVYDDTVTTPVADLGMTYHAFGAAQGVTAGTFTVVWDSNGIFRLTL